MKRCLKWMLILVITLVVGVGVFFLGLRFCAMVEPEHEPLQLDPALCACLQSGDLVLRMGRGVFSEYFAGWSPGYDNRYSHIGIIDCQPSGVVVLHAVADDYAITGAVQSQPLEMFLSPQDALAWAIYRPVISREEKQAVVVAAYQLLGQPFDFCFDHTDKSAFYCTEFVEEAFLQGGVSVRFRYDREKLPVGEFQQPSFAMEIWNSTHGYLCP